MKKILLIAFAGIIAATTVNAQIQTGNVLVGTDIANFKLGLNTGSAFDVHISPKAAWFVRDNVALGGYVDFDVTGKKSESTNTTYGVGLLGRIYAGKAATDALKHTRFFGEANFGFEGANASSGASSTNGLGFGFGPGIAYFITPSIGLEGLLKYNGIAGFGSQTYQNTLTLNFGFQIYLPGKGTRDKVKSDMK